MKRNENANCGNCPYWASWIGTGSPDHIGECRQTSVKPNDKNQRWETTGANEWCGQHPDFWEAEVVQAAPKCEPTQEALEEIARLLNDGKHAEAVKELRRMHGLKFVCTNCGDISSSAGPGFVCRECGGYLTTRVVAAKETGQ